MDWLDTCWMSMLDEHVGVESMFRMAVLANTGGVLAGMWRKRFESARVRVKI